MKNFFKKIIVWKLTWIARAILARHNPTIIAVTGSVGKTSTKDAIYTALKNSASIRRSEKSYNSELGVPLSIIGAQNPWSNPLGWVMVIFHGIGEIFKPQGNFPKMLVLEVGADRPGDIEKIAKWLRPHVVVITLLPDIPVHIEFFPTLESLISEKLSLAKYLRKEGTLVLNADDSRVLMAKEKYHARTITYGLSSDAMLRGSDIRLLSDENESGEKGGLNYKINFDGKSLPVILPNIYSESFVYVTLAALATAYALGENMINAIGSLEEYQTPPGRARLILGKNDTLIIDDTYNSSPAAVEGGLTMLKNIPFGKRKIAVLGDMLELGRLTNETHFNVGKTIKEHAGLLIAVGQRARQFAEGAKEGGMAKTKIIELKNADEAGEFLLTKIRPGDVIFIKGSQSMRMERTVKMLMEETDRAGELLVRQEEIWEKK